jgi:hypothetical protein
MPSFVVTHRTRLFAFDGLEAATRHAKQAAVGTRTSSCWARMSPGSCSEQACSTSYESTSFRSCWALEHHCSTASGPS